VKQKAKETFQKFLTDRGLKSTEQRCIILEAFLDLGRHLHVDEFYPILRARHPNIGHATVYRALKLFAESGIAREIHFGDGITRYEEATLGERHDHLVCIACGAVTEFKNNTLELLQGEISKDHGFRIETIKMELRGVCGACLARGKDDGAFSTL
jgi:Fur family transcriptional regulator, ferric uptake regulator